MLPCDLEEWPPALNVPDVTVDVMLDWHRQGCEWPVSGDRITKARGSVR